MNPPLTPALRERVENTIRFLAADAVQRANSGHLGAPMAWRGPSSTLVDATCASTRRPRAGRCATASFFRRAMPGCCLLAAAPVRVTRSRWTRSRSSVSSTRRRRATRSMAIRPVSRSPRDRSGRALGTGSGWRSRRALRAPALRRRRRARPPPRLRGRQRRRPDGGGLRRGGLARRAIGSSTI